MTAKLIKEDHRCFQANNLLLGTAYYNCEVRIFNFTDASTSLDAHLVEHEDNRKFRMRPMEIDPSVLTEMVGTEGEN
jgi:hypothetical protein